jgi:hypothetical protein
MRDFAFKILDLAGDLERVVVGPHDDDDGDDGGLDGGNDGGLDSFGSDSDSNGGAPPAVTTSA